MHTPPVHSLQNGKHSGRAVLAVRVVRLVVLGTAALLATACGMLPPPAPIVTTPVPGTPPADTPDTTTAQAAPQDTPVAAPTI